jgi:hypothetical protein
MELGREFGYLLAIVGGRLRMALRCAGVNIPGIYVAYSAQTLKHA